MPPAPSEITSVFRAAHGRVFGYLVRTFGDFSLAEDALQDAWLRALERWPHDGIPQEPTAWLTTVARNAALNARRHAAVVQRSEPHVRALSTTEPDPGPDEHDVPDERLRLMFTCCHPALAMEARVALTLRTVCGLPTAAIAALFFVPEATVAQRLVRAKRKIKAAAIAYEIPRADRLASRIDDVLACIYLLFTEGHAPTEGTLAVREALCAEAIRLARVLVHAFVHHAEARGLLALMRLHHARRGSRTDRHGRVVPLQHQDRDQWSRPEIEQGTTDLHEALAAGQPGRYQLEASIAALHARARGHHDTDWSQIAGLYAELLRLAPSPSAALALAYAEGMADGPDQGLRRLDELVRRGVVEARFAALPAARAELLAAAARPQAARDAYREALARARRPGDRALLQRRIDDLDADIVPDRKTQP